MAGKRCTIQKWNDQRQTGRIMVPASEGSRSYDEYKFTKPVSIGDNIEQGIAISLRIGLVGVAIFGLYYCFVTVWHLFPGLIIGPIALTIIGVVIGIIKTIWQKYNG
jgi:hypothetical protein